MIKDEELQNIFTAYVLKAIKRGRIKYLYKKREYEGRNILFGNDEIEDRLAEDADTALFCAMDFEETNIIESIENDSLLIAILKLNDIERKILKLHAVYKMKHEDIADTLGLNKSFVEKKYQRLIAKIRKDMEGVDNEEF